MHFLQSSCIIPFVDNIIVCIVHCTFTYIGLSPNGKATDSDSVIVKVRILLALRKRNLTSKGCGVFFFTGPDYEKIQGGRAFAACGKQGMRARFAREASEKVRILLADNPLNLLKSRSNLRSYYYNKWILITKMSIIYLIGVQHMVGGTLWLVTVQL